MAVLVDLYCESLSEFYEKAKHLKYFDMHTVLFVSAFKIGQSHLPDSTKVDIPEEIANLKKYLFELMEKTSIHEDFLIMGLVREMTEWLEHSRYGLGDTISMFLNALDREDKTDRTDQLAQENIAKLTSIEYRRGVDEQIDAWSQIVAKNFTIENKREYEYQEHKKISDSFSRPMTLHGKVTPVE